MPSAIPAATWISLSLMVSNSQLRYSGRPSCWDRFARSSHTNACMWLTGAPRPRNNLTPSSYRASGSPLTAASYKILVALASSRGPPHPLAYIRPKLNCAAASAAIPSKALRACWHSGGSTTQPSFPPHCSKHVVIHAFASGPCAATPVPTIATTIPKRPPVSCVRVLMFVLLLVPRHTHRLCDVVFCRQFRRVILTTRVFFAIRSTITVTILSIPQHILYNDIAANPQ